MATDSSVKVEKGTLFPRQGTALLVATSVQSPSIVVGSGTHTMFSGTLLEVLQSGDEAAPIRLSLQDVGRLVQNKLLEEFGDKAARPEVHSPQQIDGDVAVVPLFPNPANPSERESLSTTTFALPSLAGYESDRAQGGTDYLNVAPDVNTLCMVLASTKTQPPLSVGLFGDWGSGKSFFMDRDRRRIRQLAEASRLAKQESRDTYLCSEIRQVTFNAWHYADANLWASLVTRLFEALDTGDEDESTADERAREKAKDEGTKIYRELRAAKRLRADLSHRRKEKQDCIDQGKYFARRSAREELTKLGEVVRGEVLTDLNRIAGTLGLKDDPSVAEIQELADDFHQTGKRLIKVWKQLRTSGQLTVIGIMAFAALVGAFALLSGSETWTKVGATIVTAATSLAALVGLLKKPYEVL